VSVQQARAPAPLAVHAPAMVAQLARRQVLVPGRSPASVPEKFPPA